MMWHLQGYIGTLGVIFVLHGLSKFGPEFAGNLSYMGLAEMQILMH